MSDNIKVAVRIRNLISREKDKEATIYWKAKNSSTIFQNNTTSSFCYDRVFDGFENNEVVYSEFCSPIVKSVVNGFNGTIFAYGQTSSGKTYTIMGDEKTPGIAYHTVMELFEQIQNMPDREFLLRVSFMEIYNETVKDLLTSSGENLKLQEDQYGNIKVHKLTETYVQEPDQVLELMKQGQRQRKTGETKQNDKSSRSHFIFRMIIESGLSGNVNAAVNVSHFNFVDLAGSEKVSLNAPNALRFKEGVNINVSLFMLGQVISQLSSGKEHQFINYRDSKLTRILQNSLGGNALTAIICTVTPASLEETLSTLKFALRAKKIKNKPQVNEILTEQAVLKKLAKERKRLTEALEATKKEKNQEEKRLKELQQQIENVKKNFVIHIAPEKFIQRSSRRETWGGCLDMARMTKMFTPIKSTGLLIEHSSQDLSESNFSIKERKRSHRKSMFGDNNLFTHEEETETLPSPEGCEAYDVEQFRNRISEESIDVIHANCLKTDEFVQTGNSLCDSFSEMRPESEKIEELSEKIKSLEKELSELREYTKLEKKFSDPFYEYQKKETEALNVSQRNLSYFSPLIGNKSCISYDADDSLGIMNNLIYRENKINKDAMNLDQEFFFNQFTLIIENLEKLLGFEVKLPSISNLYLKVIFHLFSFIFLNQTTSQINLAKNLSKEIEGMLSILGEIFVGFSSKQGLAEEYKELVSKFTDATDIIAKEMQLSSAKINANANTYQSIDENALECVMDKSNIDIPDIINISSSNFYSTPKVTAKTFVAKETQTNANDDSAHLSQLCDQYQEQISLLEKRLEDNIKAKSKLESDCNLKEKQTSLLREKINIQEQVIASLRAELTLKNECQDSNFKNCNFSDNSTQTHYFSNFNHQHSSDLDKELNASVRLSNKEFNTSIVAGNLEHSLSNSKQSSAQKDFEYSVFSTPAVLEENSKNTMKEIGSLIGSKVKMGSGKESLPDSVMTEMSSILQEISDLRELVFKTMNENMQKVYMGGDDFIISDNKLDLLDSLKNQVKVLRDMLQRIEFFFKDKSDAMEQLHNVIKYRGDEILSVKSQCRELEKNLKDKETQLENLNAELNLLSEEVKEKISQNNLKIDFEGGGTKIEFLKNIFILKKALKYFEKICNDKNSYLKVIPQTSVKCTQTVENYPDLAELEKVRAFEFKERENLSKENSSLKLNIKELNQLQEDLKKALQLRDKEIIVAKDLQSEEIKSMISLHEMKEKRWEIQMDELKKKYEKELTDQEKEMFDSMDEIKEGYLRLSHENKEKFEKDVIKIKSYYEEKISSLENQLIEEKNNSCESKSRLEKEISDYKNNADAIKQSYYDLKTKFKVYIQDVKLKMNRVKPVKEVETQTDLLSTTVKDLKRIEVCNECVSLREEIINLKNQAKIEKICRPLETEPSKDLKNELCLKNSKIISLETNKENMIREIAALKKEIVSKSNLLQSCQCRRIIKPEDVVEKFEHSSKSNNEKVSNKCTIEDEIRDGTNKNPEDILKLDLVQRAIEKAREEERQIFYRAEGPASDVMNLYLKRQLNKKDHEISGLKKSLAVKSNISSENKPLSEFKPRNKILHSKHPIGNLEAFQQNCGNLVLSEENTPCIKLSNPPEKTHKVHPKKVLIEHNKRNQPPHIFESSKPPNTSSSTSKENEKEKELEERLQKLVEDPLVPNCKQQ